MRVIAGRFGGRRLRAPKGSSTRPTADRVREALFSILGPPPEDAVVLDLFAGAGTLGLESLSRGARRAVFVDSARAAVACLEDNIKSLGAELLCEVHPMDVMKALPRLARSHPAMAWVFLDPPYRTDVGLRVMASLADSPLVGPESIVVCEHDRRETYDDAIGALRKISQRSYGDTCLSLYRR